jgi:outer membrane lipoprotein-sorting protein
MNKLLRVLLLVGFIGLAAAAHADQAKPVDLTTEDQAELKQIETYLNSVTTAKAHFTQIGDKGVSSGTFYLDRPGRLRFDYDEPRKDIILADRKLIWFYDAETKEANHAPINRTLANFLLQREIQLSGGDVTVTDFQHGDNAVQLVMTATDDPGQGTFALTLSEHPMQIRAWRVVDSQNRTTQVTLDNEQYGVALDPALFVWHDPE